MFNTTINQNFNSKKEENPLEKYLKRKTINDFINPKFKSEKKSLTINKEKEMHPGKMNKRKFGDFANLQKKQKRFFEDKLEDLTQEYQNKSKLKLNHLDLEEIKISRGVISKNKLNISSQNLVNLIEEEKEGPSRFSQFSIKQSKYIIGQKLLSTIKLTKGNIKDNEPKRIICGYQKEDGQKIYLVEWDNSEDSVILPSFIQSEILKDKHTALIVEYLENIIVKH